MVCTFFGHRDTPTEVKGRLKETLTKLITEKSVDCFFVGDQGAFDSQVELCLKELKRAYPHIRCSIVLAYMPKEKYPYTDCEKCDTIYPEGLEDVPPKYAIDKRNRRMLEKADYVVTYVTSSVGGAAKFKKLAEKQRKHVINLPENPENIF